MYGDDLGEFENLNFEFLRVKSQRAWGTGAGGGGILPYNYGL